MSTPSASIPPAEEPTTPRFCDVFSADPDGVSPIELSFVSGLGSFIPAHQPANRLRVALRRQGLRVERLADLLLAVPDQPGRHAFLEMGILDQRARRLPER